MSQNADSTFYDQYVTQPEGPTAGETFRKVLTPLASLRITVVLFALGFTLIFLGTLAQMEEDVWPVVEKYFRNFYVWVPLQLLAKFGVVFFNLAPDTHWNGSFPFPGGWLIGGAMMINLLAAHAIRFRMTWKRSGIFLIHGGVVLLMVGELITGLYAVESRMTMQLGETTDFIDVTRRYELVIASPIDEKTQQVIRIPDEILQEYRNKTLKHESLPVDIEVVEYWKNTTAEPALVKDEEGKETKITAWPGDNGLVRLDGVYMRIVPAREEAGVESAKDNAPAYRLRLKKKDSEEVVSEIYISLLHYRNFFNRFYYPLKRTFTVNDTTYRILYRNERVEKPYSLKMLKFEHEVHPGTSKSKSYASTVELHDQRTGENREVRIHMNSPLRHDGLTFYQAGFVPDDSGTVLQVVKNPAWLLPYIACVVVAVGMLVHFGLHLDRFLKRRAAK